MLNTIKQKLNLYFNIQDVSIKSITLLSICMYMLLLIFYTSQIFYQFSIYQIISLAIIFLTLLFGLTFIFDQTYFKENIKFNITNIFIAILITFLVIMIESTASIFIDYYRTFPLLEAELGLDVHPDTSFHVSLIQSIMSYGYPSTMQHGAPIIYYHILSHYLDAFILSITGLDPFDSYGLLYFFKIFLFLSSILIFLSQIIKNKHPFIYIASLFILAPMLASTWSAVGSHALWITSVIVLLSAHKTFNILTKNKKNSLKDFIYLFILIIVISIGKISVGFVYAVFIGMFLLLKQWKDYKVYLIGTVWILFFLLFQKLLFLHTSSTAVNNFSFIALYNLFINISDSPYKMLQSNYISILILMILYILYRTKNNYRLLVSSVSALLIIGIIITIKGNEFIRADIFYFEYSLAFILILFMFQNIFYNVYTFNKQVVALLALVFLSNFYYLSKFNILSMGTSSIGQRLQSLNYTPFNNISKKLSTSEKVNFINGGIQTSWVDRQDRPLHNFRKGLNEFLISNKIDKKNILLFIPKEIYEKDLYFIKRKDWSKGLFIYAMTGTPLIYANKELIRGFGYQHYTNDSLWVYRDNFNPKKVCSMKFANTIIVVQNFWTPQFSIIDCHKIK